jgi:hypothetical protein
MSETETHRKVIVITDDGGKVLGTAQIAESAGLDEPGFRPVPGSGQRLHEVEMPADLADTADVEKLHQGLERLIRGGATKAT